MAEVGEVEQRTDLPEVKYSEEVQSPDCPYDISVDPQGFSDLLVSQGVSKNDIPKIKINVNRKPSGIKKVMIGDGHVYGAYNTLTKNLDIYTDIFWDFQKEKVDEKLRALDGEGQDNDDQQPPQFSRQLFKSRKRLDWYLSVAPPERAKKTLERLARIATEREMNTTMAHESSHATDDLTKIHSISNYKKLLTGSVKVGAASIGITEGIVFTINQTNLADGDSLKIALAAGISLGGMMKLDVLGVINYGKKRAEKRAYDFQKEHEGEFKIVALSPKTNSS